MKRRTKLVLAGVLLFIAVLILAFYGRSDRAMRFGTAGIGGVYYNFGQEFGDFLSDEGLKIDVKETAGSAANLRLLSGGFIQIAIAQTDVLNDAWTGTEMFDGKDPLRGYSAVASLYTEACQVVTTAASGIESVRDLSGKTVSTGEKESGTEQNAKQILRTYGLSEDMVEEVSLNYADAAKALESGEIDAFFYTGGIQTGMIEDLAEKTDIRLLPVDGKERENLTSAYSYYSSCVIPAKTYTGQDTEVETIGVRSVLVVNDKVKKDTARKIAQTLYEHVEELQSGVTVELSLSAEDLPIPLHEGAKEYYATAGAS